MPDTTVRDPEEFDRWLNQAKRSQSVLEAMIEVADTAEGCMRWFRSQGLQASAADVVAMTDLVLDRAYVKDQEAT
jgi:hypothetical protein